MGYPEELCQLVIRNMAIIEDAPKVVEEVEHALFNAINKRIEAFVSARDGWKGYYDFVTNKEDEETTFAPVGWPEDEAGSYLAWYTLGGVEGDGVDRWLSHAIGVRNAVLCFWFEIGNGIGELTVKEKKSRCQQFYAATPAVQQAGFQYDKSGGLFLPFTLDAETLATEFPDFDTALAPLDKALDALLSVHAAFDGFVQEIQKAAR